VTGRRKIGRVVFLLDGEPVVSCLVPLIQCRNRSIETVEVLADEARRAFSEKLVESGGVQCGACTPGIALTAWALFKKDPSPGVEEVRQALAGNICRCATYPRIRQAVREAAAKVRS